MLANVTNALAHYAPWLFAIFAKVAVLLVVTLLCAQSLRRGSASLRHCLHAAAMAGALMLPIAATFLPTLRIAVLPSLPAATYPAGHTGHPGFLGAPPRTSRATAPRSRTGRSDMTRSVTETVRTRTRFGVRHCRPILRALSQTRHDTRWQSCRARVTSARPMPHR